MKRYFQKVLAVVLSCFTAVQMITPTFAQEQDVSSMSANSIVSVSVQGEGNVVVQESGQSHTVTEDSPLSIETTPDQTISFSIEKQEGLTISSFKENGENVSSFEMGSEEFYYDFVTTSEDADFVITFDKQQEESKLNTSIESENEAAKDEDVGEDEKNNDTSQDDSGDVSKSPWELDGIHLEFKLNEEPTKELKKMLDAYKAGNYKSYKDERKKVAEETGLIKYADSDYFMNDEFYEKYSSTLLLFGGASVVDRHLTKEYLNSLSKPVNSKAPEKDSVSISRKALKAQPRSNVITNAHSYTWYHGVGYLMNESFDVSGVDTMVYCANGLYATPPVGSTLQVSESSNANLRRALYYGYGGPGDMVLNGLAGGNWQYAIVITCDLVSYAHSGSSLGANTYNGYHWNNGLGALYNQIMSQPDPAQYGYTAYVGYVPGQGWSQSMQIMTPYQNLAWGKYNPTGSLQISKVSANPDITSGNSCYNLEGAQYGLYTDAGATNQINTLTIGADGWSNKVDGLTAGTYYIKEIKAPQGYALDPTIYSIQVDGGTTATKELKDLPQSDPVGILLGKIDKETNANKPQGSASLADAQFTVKYYKGLYDNDPAKQGVSPARTWIFKTNENGFAYFSDAFKVSGDEFYYNGSSAPTIPVGTITIQETKAPEGYYINNEVFVRQITSEGTAENVSTYNEPKVPEQVIKFRIHKIQEDSNVAIDGAVFRHTKPDGSTEELTTDDKGNIEIVGLETGKHTLQEISVMDGYEINSTKVEFEVKSGGKLIMLTDLTGTGIVQETESDGNTKITVSDEVSDYDFKLIKINDHDKLLDGAEFTLYEDKECTKPIDVQTTKNGQLEFKNLKDRTNYYFKETKAPQGYRIPFDPTTKAPHVYRVYVESTPAQGKFNFWIDNVMYTVNNTNKDDAVHLEGTTADRVISIEIVNYVGVQLPATGSNMTLIILGIGLAMMTGAYFFNKRKKETKGE